MTLISSPFNAKSSAEDVIQGHNLTGKTAIVTGGASGIGIETARVLAEAGADVVIAARNAEQAQQAIKELNNTAPNKASWGSLDLSSLNSVRRFAADWGNKPLNLLINNAGVMGCPLGYTEDGLEMQIGTNHFGHYLLSVLLSNSLKQAAQSSGVPSRVVTLSSVAHHYSDVDFDDPHFRSKPYDQWKSYGQSKTANILFAFWYDMLNKNDGVRAYSVMPGRILTGLMRHMSADDKKKRGLMDEHGNMVKSDVHKTVPQGAATTIWAAVGKELDETGGIYLEDCNQAPLTATRMVEGLEPYAVNAVSGERLWKLSRETTGA